MFGYLSTLRVTWQWRCNSLLYVELSSSSSPSKASRLRPPAPAANPPPQSTVDAIQHTHAHTHRWEGFNTIMMMVFWCAIRWTSLCLCMQVATHVCVLYVRGKHVVGEDWMYRSVYWWYTMYVNMHTLAQFIVVVGGEGFAHNFHLSFSLCISLARCPSFGEELAAHMDERICARA